MGQSERAALVTGGSRGIGRAVCLAFAAQGTDVAINYTTNIEAAQRVSDECQAFGVKSIIVQGDVSNNDDCENLAAATKETFGRIDILVNNAGITRDGLLMRMGEKDFDDVIDTNLKGAFLCMKTVVRTMMRQRSGRIINMGSVVGLHGNIGQANYAASKAGLIGMSKSAAKEFAGRGITVNMVAPGFIDTDMTAVLPDEVREQILKQIPLGRLGDADEVARVVAFFADSASGYLTGQIVCVDGGMAI